MTSSKYVVIQWGPDSTFLTSWGNFIHDGPETNNTARHSSNFSCGPSRVSFEVSQPTRVPLHVGVLIKAIGGTRKLNDSMIIAYPYFTILSYPIRSDPILSYPMLSYAILCYPILYPCPANSCSCRQN